MSETDIKISLARAHEFEAIGKLLVQVYSRLEGFPKPHEQPGYYHLLANVGDLTRKPGVEIWQAHDRDGKLCGAVVYFTYMQYYGSGGTATQETQAAGFRLLGVSEAARGRGVGRRLTHVCIDRARATARAELIIHTTKSMSTAWKMYESIGFTRSEDLDFMQGDLQVFGFRLRL